MILRLIFGYYFSFGNSRWVHFISIAHCLLFILALLILLVILPSSSMHSISNVFNTLVTVADFVLSLIFKSNYMEKMLTTLCRTGDLLHVKTVALPWKLFAYLLCVWIGRLFATVTSAQSNNFTLLHTCMNIVVITSIHVNYNSKIFVFYSLYQRMKLLRHNFDHKYPTINLIGSERRKYKINNIRNCLTVYDLLLKFFKKMDVQIEIWVSYTIFLGSRAAYR